MRKYRIRAIFMTMMLLLGVLCMTGCEQEEVYVPITVNTVEVKADGSLVGYMVEDFDKEYYNISELDEMVRSEISAYNDENKGMSTDTGRVPVIVDKVMMAEDGSKKAVVALNFLNSKVYEDYMDKSLFFGTLNEAIAAGYDVDGKLYKVKNKELLSAEQIMKIGEKKILILEDEISVRTSQKVQYLSENASLNENGYVDCKNNGELKYIILK